MPIASVASPQANKDIQLRLGFSGNEVDGIMGSNTTLKIETLLVHLADTSSRTLPTRIRNLQSELGIEPTGDYNLATFNKLEELLKLTPLSQSRSMSTAERLQMAIGFSGNEVDGIFGVNTTFRFEVLITSPFAIGRVATGSLRERIKTIQNRLNTTPTGDYNLETLNAIEYLLDIHPVSVSDTQENRKRIQRKLGFKGSAVDGIFGVNTTSKIEQLVSVQLPPIPQGASLVVSQKSIDLLVEFEVSSKAYYEKALIYPVFPGGSSGVTIGIGYDLGQVSRSEFKNDWQGVLSNEVIERLSAMIGLSGNAAQRAVNSLGKTTEIPFEAAKTVFYSNSLPNYAAAALSVYPGLNLLPPDAQGAILSLVYNRGTSLSGATRKEMANLQKWIFQNDLQKIAAEIRDMKRLWTGKGLSGLLARREEESKLVENANYFFRPSDLIFI